MFTLVRVSALTMALMMVAAPGANAQFGKILERIGQGAGASDSKTASGLKEALQIGTDHAVDFTSAPDGFFKNQVIKILLPEKLRMAEKGLRLAGMGPKLDEFVLSMNRAAEQAAPAARTIFKDAVTKMTFQDVKTIFTGGDTAATQYFKGKTTEQLTAAFRPTVEAAMEKTGVVKQYKQLTGGFTSLLGARGQDLDITAYVVGKSLDGLFYMLGEEEKKIRTNPAAQITPLLKEVFGKR
jgi:hypothetical protein